MSTKGATLPDMTASPLDKNIMQGSPCPPELRADLSNWDSPPFNRWSFCHVAELMPSARVYRGIGPTAEFRYRLQPIDGVQFAASSGDKIRIADWFDRSYTDGFIVLHNGDIVFEHYAGFLDSAGLHLSESVAKSVVGAAAGILIGQRRLEPDQLLTRWIPELQGTGYEGATVRHVMDMTSGVRFSEEYADPDCDCAVLERVSGWRPSCEGDQACLFDYILTLPREVEHGSRMAYRSVETEVLGICLERASGRRLSDLVSELLWVPLGVEEDARFTVDTAGTASASGGFNATLRDYARFGEMLTRDGLFNGRQIIPASFIQESRRGVSNRLPQDNWISLQGGAYRNTFWNRNVNTRVLLCLGIFGQFIYSDPDNSLTVVKLSTWPEPLNDEQAADTMAAIDAIARYLGDSG